MLLLLLLWATCEIPRCVPGPMFLLSAAAAMADVAAAFFVDAGSMMPFPLLLLPLVAIAFAAAVAAAVAAAAAAAPAPAAAVAAPAFAA